MPIPHPNQIRRRLSVLLGLLASFGLVLLFSGPPPLLPAATPATHASPSRNDDDDDYAAYSALESQDGDASFFERIERAQVAPVELIGKVPALQVGSLLQSTQTTSSAFPAGSLVLVTELGLDFYRGVIINSPLPVGEQEQARQMLRVSDTVAAPKPTLDRVLFYGYGGPVKTQEHRWQIVHDNVQAVGAVVVSSDHGRGIAVGGDFVHELLTESTRVLLLYGSAVWLPGQLEREILQHEVWQLLPGRAHTFDDLLRLCHL